MTVTIGHTPRLWLGRDPRTAGSVTRRALLGGLTPREFTSPWLVDLQGAQHGHEHCNPKRVGGGLGGVGEEIPLRVPKEKRYTTV